MEEPKRPAELSEEAWEATPLEVRLFLTLLREKIAQLEARLNQNSQNSSKPPSSDPPSTPAPTKTPRGKPKAKGAQPGHADQQRELLPEAEVDRVIPIHPTCCPHCQDMLPASLPPVCLPRRQQVWELPEVRPEVIEYQYLTVCCPGCGDLVTAPPSPELPPLCFGPRVVALIALLHGRFRISDRELVVLLQMVWLLPISLGSVAQLQQVASAALAPAYAEVQQAVEEAEQANVDETSWREGALKPWLWVAVTAVATLFRIQYGRGRAQLVALVGAAFLGLVTSDRHSAYNKAYSDLWYTAPKRGRCRMGRWYDGIASDGARVQALTSLTVEEFAELVGPFEAAFQERMASFTLEGKRRKNRRYTPYANSPLPSAEDRLFFILSYLKENPTQTYHGYLFGLPQCKVNQWIHTLFPVLRTALRAMGAAPARSFAALSEQLDDVVVNEEPPDTPPLFAMTAPSDPSRAPTMRLNRSASLAARNASIR